MDAAYTGNRISALRREKNWTQKELAAQLHVTDKAISKWERGLNYPELSLLEPLSAALGTTVADLLGLEETSGAALLEAATELHKAEQARLTKKLKSCGYLLVAGGALAAVVALVLLTTIQPWATPLKLAVGLAALLAAVLLIVGRDTLIRYGDLWGPSAPPFVVTAPSSHYLSLSGQHFAIRKDPPEEPQTQSLKGPVDPKFPPALYLLLLILVAEVPLAVLSLLFPSRLNVFAPVAAAVVTGALCRLIPGKTLRVAAILGILHAVLTVVELIALPSLAPSAVWPALAAALLSCVSGAVFLRALFGGLSDFASGQGLSKAAESSAFAANLAVAAYVAAALLAAAALHNTASGCTAEAFLPVLLSGAAAAAGALRQGALPPVALHTAAFAFGSIASHHNTLLILLGLFMALLAVLHYAALFSFFRQFRAALSTAEKPEEAPPNP